MNIRKSRKEKELTNILNDAKQTMKTERMSRVMLGVEEYNGENPNLGWFNINKKWYFPQETNLPDEQKLVDEGKTYNANALLMKHETGAEVFAFAYIERHNTTSLNLTEGKEYVNEIQFSTDIEGVAKQLVEQKVNVKEFKQEIESGIEKTKEFQIQRYKNKIGDNPVYEASKQTIENRNCPTDEAIFSNIRDAIYHAKKNN